MESSDQRWSFFFSASTYLSYLNSMKYAFALLLNLCFISMTAQTSQKKFLALGDSYTIGESVAAEERWPVQLVRALNTKGEDFAAPDIIATTGWRTDELMKAIDTENPRHDYDLVSLLIGVNNQYQGRPSEEYEIEFEKLLQKAIAFAGGDNSKVIVLSIPDYGYTPFGKEKIKTISREIDELNAINMGISKKHDVTYVYITDISRHGLDDSDLVASDGLHPSAKMYAKWVEEILSKFAL